MDIILSATSVGVEYHGKFDGFPLTVDAGYHGVAMFVTDPMGQNEDFTGGRDIEIITRSSESIVEKIRFYYDRPHLLHRLAQEGQRILWRIRDGDSHLAEKAAVIEDLLEQWYDDSSH